MAPIDPHFQALLELLGRLGVPPIGSVPAAELRAALKMSLPPEPPVHEVRDAAIANGAVSLPVRIYRPAANTSGVIVYFHGGGWTFGDLDSVDPLLRGVANTTGCTVVSVDYRLAPEHPFPAAVEDAYAAVKWAFEQRAAMTGRADSPLMVMGDSAGGNLAAVVSQLARDAAGPAIALQVLLYPVTEGDADHPDVQAFASPFLTAAELAWCCDQYIPRAQRNDPRYAPAKAADLSRLPPALIVTAEHDVLAAEGRRYADKLRAAGNEVTVVEGVGAIHAFMSLAPASPIGLKVMAAIAAEVERVSNRAAVQPAS